MIRVLKNKFLICLLASIAAHACLFHLPKSSNENKQEFSLGPIHPLSLFHKITSNHKKTNVTQAPPTQAQTVGGPSEKTASAAATAQSETQGAEYRNVIQNALWQINPEYPYSSRQKGEQGIVRLRIRVSASGAIENVEVIESSHSKKLDEAAVKAFLNARVNATWPAALSKSFPMTFEKNVIFKLN